MTTDAELLDIVAPLADRLERIAVALEAIQAYMKPSALAAFNASAPRTVGPAERKHSIRLVRTYREAKEWEKSA